MKTIAIAFTALALAAALAATGYAVEVEPNEDPRCTYSVKKRFRLGPFLRNGIPVRVTCDGPAETSSILLISSRKQDDDWEDLHNHGIPGIANSDILTFEEAGTKTLRVWVVPKKFFRRYAVTKFRVLLGVERDPPYHSSVDGGKVITVVR
jgi:hypothetical protein